jgi:hypothetical protein
MRNLIVDHLEGVLACLIQEDFAALPPARLQRLSDQLYRWHCEAELLTGAQPFPRVRKYPKAPKSGVLADLYWQGGRTE